MSDVTATTPTPSTGEAAGDPDRTILAVIDRGGLAITEHELRYRLERRGVELVGLLDRMMDLEARGLIEGTFCFRVAQQGLEQLRDGHQRPVVAGYRSEWRCDD